MAQRSIAHTLLGDCRIVGTGERRGGPEAPFEVFASSQAREASFVIARPQIAHVVWVHFPERADDGRTRALIDIGGQAHVRYEGYVGLYGRTFTTKRRMESVAGHLWAHAGAPIDMMSATSTGSVFARVTTPFVAPKTIVVQGNCADVVYDADVAGDPPRERDSKTASRPGALELFASPTSARAFTTITPKDSIAVDVLERREGFVHIAADEDWLGLDAWVPSSQIVDVTDASLGRVPRIGDLTMGSRTELPHARVSRDTPLLVGFTPTTLQGAIVEAGAEIAFDVALTEKVDTSVAFEFPDDFIVAREGEHLWIARDALSPE